MPANTPLVRLLKASWFVWLLLALPGVVLTYRYARGALFYGEYLHATGELGVRLLMLAMAMTPLKLVFPRATSASRLSRTRWYTQWPTSSGKRRLRQSSAMRPNWRS
jgi:hypothetical protein